MAILRLTHVMQPVVFQLTPIARPTLARGKPVIRVVPRSRALKSAVARLVLLPIPSVAVPLIPEATVVAAAAVFLAPKLTAAAVSQPTLIARPTLARGKPAIPVALL